MSPSARKPTLVRRSVVELDLVGYSHVARQVEAQTDARALMYLKDQVQGFVDEGLREAGCARKDVGKGTAGDSALLVFERASEAHRFSEAVHRATAKHNTQQRDPATQRHFRIGISTGEIALRGKEVSGTRIIDSVRLEATGTKGHILIDEATYEELPAKFQRFYRGPESVTDKQNRTYLVYRYVVSRQAAAERMIQEAAADPKVTELDLSNLGLVSFPETIAPLAHLKRLNVSGNQLTSLPESLGELAQLQSLNVSGNQLTALPESLGQLAELRSFIVYGNQLTALPESLGELAQLQSLNVLDNQLTALPESLGQLSQLQSLDVSNNQLTALPESLGQLAELQSLVLFNNKLTALPESLGQLAQLGVLAVYSNQLSALPESLGQLAHLERIDVDRNELTILPESLGQLTQLRTLDVSGNQLTALPESMRRLSSLRELFLHGNIGLGISPEVLGPRYQEVHSSRATAADPAHILDFYFRTRRGQRPLNEAKLILVGRGGVGKTSLIKRLMHDRFNEHEPETPGINIEPWDIVLADADKVRLHVWDFGGQRILHGTHQFFLTERTLYLLVLSGREDNATQDAEYWLQLIRSFGGESRVVIALNKIEQHPFDVNRGLLLEKYPFIAGFVRTDCKAADDDGSPAVGLAELHNLIHSETAVLEHRKTAFPADWFRIKEHLASMEESFIAWDDYQGICQKLGETDVKAQRDLSRFLHILGIALNYADDPRLLDTRVLKPTWVTDGLYTLLRALQQQNTGGVLMPGDLGSALDPVQYPASKHDFLLRLMEKFQLCFRLAGRDERYLVPELLGENQPDLSALLAEPGLGFRYQYEVLPEGLLPRFIVQTHRQSEAQPRWRWRTGVVLERDACRAVVRADVRERRVDIYIVGSEPSRRGLLAVIRAAFDEQHNDLKGLTVDERVPVPGDPGVTESYAHLLQLETEGEEWCRPSASKQRHRVKDLLNGVESEADRRRKRGEERLYRSRDRIEGNDRTKTVVELDLAGYTRVVVEIADHLGVDVVLQFNEQIQSFVDKGLAAVDLSRDEIVKGTAGDNAILVFDRAADAHKFAEAVHRATEAHNASKKTASAKRWFRVGVATGDVAMRGEKIAGPTIINAVRLEAAGTKGHVLIDESTFQSLPSYLKSEYGALETVTDKNGVSYNCHRCVVVNVDDGTV